MGLSKSVGLIVKIGVFISGLFQIIFSFFLKNNLFGKYNKNAFLFLLLGGIFFIIAGILNTKEHFKFHSITIKLYSVSTFIGLFLFSLTIKNYLSLVLLIVFLLMFLGSVYFYVVKKYLYSEIWVIFFLSLWTMCLYASL